MSVPLWITHALPDVAFGGTVRHPQSKAYKGDETPLLFVTIVTETHEEINFCYTKKSQGETCGCHSLLSYNIRLSVLDR
jgi:hypothetical protein